MKYGNKDKGGSMSAKMEKSRAAGKKDMASAKRASGDMAKVENAVPLSNKNKH